MDSQTNNTTPSGSSRRNWAHELFESFRKRFDLTEDSAPQAEVVENIRRGVIFRGTNLWILIFATFVASLGLNVNSTAVIIGAMLISPLMGPIMGFGLALGINDSDLLKRSLRNFGFMVGTSIVTATIYFMISPLSNAQSELLARTMPTTYDVLIAFFGGAAGIVAQTRKDRTYTVISGVAIATALMPPLCTAGFGLATLQFRYFLGAAYLFFINTVFIALATYLVVRFLKYDKKVFVEPQAERKMKRYMMAVTLITIIPSIFLAYRIINQTFFEENAERYVQNVFQFPETRVLEYSKHYSPRRKTPSTLEIVLFGKPIEQDVIENARAQLAAYDLKNCTLIVRQPNGTTDMIDISSMQHGYSELLDEKNRQIAELEEQLALHNAEMHTEEFDKITRECGVLFSNIERISLSRQVVFRTSGQPCDTILVCIVAPTTPLTQENHETIVRWLQVRSKTEKVKLYVE